MVDRLERLTNLVALLLNTRVPLTLDEICIEIEGYPTEPETRRQAFERDKRLLRDENVPVESVTIAEGRTGYRINPDEYYLPELDLTDSELVALNMAVAAVHLEGGRGREALWAVGDAGVDDVPALAAIPVIDALPALFDGWRTRAPVSFTYRSQPRILEPWGFLFRDGYWYVAGRDADRDEERVFRADRIQDKVAIGEAGSFMPPPDFDARRLLPSQAYQLAGGRPVDVEVEVDAGHAARAVADAGEAAVVERRPDGAVVVRIAVTNTAAFRSWLFGFLEHARVVAPPDVRASVIKWLEAMAK